MYLGTQVTQPCHFLLHTPPFRYLQWETITRSMSSKNELSGNTEMSQTVSKLLHTVIFTPFLCAVHYIYICNLCK